MSTLSTDNLKHWQEEAEPRIERLEQMVRRLVDRIGELESAIRTTNERVHTNHCDITCLEQAVDQIRNDVEDMMNEEGEEDIFS